MIKTTRVRPRAPAVKCDGYGVPYGECYQKAIKPAWPGQYGGKSLCPDCARRMRDENAYWAWITR